MMLRPDQIDKFITEHAAPHGGHGWILDADALLCRRCGIQLGKVGLVAAVGVGAVITELERLRAAVGAVRRLHWPYPGVDGDRDTTCDCCDGLGDCPTVAALDAHLAAAAVVSLQPAEEK